MADNQELDTVEHPTLGTLKFPKDMSPDDRNESIQRVLLTRPDAAAPPSAPRPQVNMESSMLAPRHDPELDKRIYQADVQSNPNPTDALVSGATLGAGLGVGTAGRAALPFVARAAARHPIITGLIGSELIHQARAIPYAGKFIPPYAEMAPYLLPGGKNREAEQPPVENEAPVSSDQVSGAPYMPRPRATYGGIPPEPIPTRPNLMLRGETAKPVEGEYLPPERLPQANQTPFAPAIEIAPRPAEPTPAPYSRSREQIIQDDLRPPLNWTPGRIPPRSGLALPGEVAPAVPTSQNVPVRRGSPFEATDQKAWNRYPAMGTDQDLAETRDIQAQAREAHEQEQRGRLTRANEEGYARNTRPRTPKGELIRQVQGVEPVGNTGIRSSPSTPANLPTTPQEQYEYAKGALTTADLAKDNQATWAPHMSPASRREWGKLVKDAERLHPEWKTEYDAKIAKMGGGNNYPAAGSSQTEDLVPALKKSVREAKKTRGRK